ncbi:MAG TPA: ABC transporter permease [Prolixibacteraceae bacterium]
MIKNYFKIAWRNVIQNKVFSFINILGLALGMVCTFLILLWVLDEYNVDAFHANKKLLYRIYMKEYFSGKQQGVIWTPGPLAAELKNTVPEIQYAVPFSWPIHQLFSVGDKANKQEVNVAGADFFKMFSFKLLQGTPQSALSVINGLAISRSMAEIFFGNPENAINKTIRFDNRKDLVVTAVFENIPANSTLKFDCLRTWDAYVNDGNEWARDWGSTDPLTFFMIRPDAQPQQVQEKIKHVLDKYRKGNERTELAMQPFHEYYLNGNLKNAKIDGGRIEYVRLFSIIAVFILLIACINFMNLATARSAKRAREVGVRKVIGALRSSLIKQFIGEAMLITFFSLVLAIVVTVLLLPFFNGLTGKQLHMPFEEFSFWGILIVFTFITGIIAGSYPAFFLSALKPVQVLKGTLRFNSKSVWFRKGLVIFQFSLSIIMIVSMIVIYRQINFIKTKNPGYERENLLYFPLEGNLIKDYEVFKENTTRISGIRFVSRMTENPVGNGSGTEAINWEGNDPNEKIRFTPVGVSYDFVKAMNLQLLEGREYSKDFASDSTGFIINETAQKAMKFKNPLGQTISWGRAKGTIIGVVKDFHFQSLHTPIRPLITYLRGSSAGDAVIVRIQAGKTSDVVVELEKAYKKMNPEFPFTYSFADEEYARQYRSEQVIGKLSDAFAFLAIFISCLGLFGLATFTAEQKKKEIGIRKVLGASVFSITSFLSEDFVKLVMIALVIASPIAWYTMHQWLENYAYRIDMSWWTFVLAGVLALVIAMFTVCFQAVKAAIANPVKSLRTE